MSKIFKIAIELTCKWQTWLYAGPSVALNAWPTCVCVNPIDNLRILNCLANSLISSKFIPSTVVLSVEFPTVSEMGTIVRNIKSFTVKFAQTEPWIWLALCCLMPFSTIFRLISWRSVLLVEETRVPGEKPLTCRKSLTNFLT